ncbi:MAG: rhodanese-like domain-containing protein [Flammeovirgaceae bacterium]
MMLIHMIRQLFLAFSLVLIGPLSFAQTSKQQQEFDQMLQGLLAHSVKEVKAKEVMNSTDIIYLDAREKNEFQVSHIPNAKWVGYNTFKKKYVDAIPKDKRIVVYCSVGYRSEKISEKLLKMGFKDVSNLYGGIFDWKHAGGKVVDTKQQETEKIHTYNKEWSKWLFQGVKVF